MRAVLFDLDGTLLDIELSDFLTRYFGALHAAAADRFPGVDLVGAIMASTEAMTRAHPGVTNHDAFWADFQRRTGQTREDHRDVFERFYEVDFPQLIAGAGPAPGARRAVESAFDAGLSVAIATNPIFPIAAVRHRLAWAGLGDLDFPVVTAYEQMHATKPLPAYFRETAELLGVEPGECLMVGDDGTLDMPAADVGMRTFFVGDGTATADWHGSLDDLAALLPRLAGDA